jgi:putative membrane-bound dehydrogenase-like protein
MPICRLHIVALLFTALVAPSLGEDFPTPYNSEKSPTSPMSPDDVVKTAKLPPGFRLSVFAAEPDVQNPIAITTDERGRIWAVENYTWAGGNLGGWDTKLKDRIVILEDTDGDGKHDKRTVFWDQGRKATSVEVGFGGVWVLNLPQLLFIPDKNRDDVPDGRPVVVLDGIDEDAVGHTPANGLKWGPDGWLYARHGIQGTSSIGKPEASDSQRVKINTGIWRFHPTRGIVEAVMHGMTNSWGFDFNEHGEMFAINTVIGHLWHVVPGAHVKRMYGTDINPHSYELIEQTADHVHWDTGESWGDVRKGVTDKTSAAGGGHAHIGLMIYQGDNWPIEYRGKVLTLNLHGQRINSDILVRDGAGYTARHGDDMCFIADPWYRAMDLIAGPDGGVFISDWSDTGECHDHDGVHRNSGRIYKLTHGTPKKVEPFDLATFDDLQLLKLQEHENDWWPRQARRIIQQRSALREQVGIGNPAVNGEARVKSQAAPSSALRSAIQKSLHEERDSVRRLRLIWTANADGASPELLPENSLNADEHERAWRLRLAMDRFSVDGVQLPSVLGDSLATLARTEPSGLIQLYLASSLQRMTISQRWPIAEALCLYPEFANDRMLPLMIWYGIEPAISRDRARALKLIAASEISLIRRNVSRRLTEDIETEPATVNVLVALAEKSDPTVAQNIVAGMAEALRGWSKAPQPAAWPSAARKFALSGSVDLKKHAQELAVVFGDGRAIDELLAMVVNGDAEPGARRQALRALLTGRPVDFVGTLQDLTSDRAMASEAIRGLALYDHPDTPSRILKSWDRYGPSERVEAINTFCARVTYARTLLWMLRNGKIAKSDISAFHARQIRAFDDPDLNSQLAELWGEVRGSTADKRLLIDRFKSQLTPDALVAARPSQGRVLFQKECASCHVLYGVGRKVGPDLTGSNRKNLDYLLENIIDPSASVAADFRVSVVVLDDGRVLNGVVSDQTDRTVTLQTAQEPITLDRKSIDQMKQTPNSLMPDGMLQNLSDEQVRDLIAYLTSLDQVALPE